MRHHRVMAVCGTLALAALAGGCAEGVPSVEAEAQAGDGEQARRVVLVAGEASHGYGAHEHYAGSTLLAEKLEAAMPDFETVVYRDGWPDDPDAFDGADAVVIYSDGSGRHPVLEHIESFDELASEGVGIGCIHFAVHAPDDEVGEHFTQWIGGYYETGYSVNPHWDAALDVHEDHPITRGVQPFEIHDEWYFSIRFPEGDDRVTPILTAVPDEEARRSRAPHPRFGEMEHILDRIGEREALMWAVEREDGGRGFGFTGGHFHWNWGHPGMRRVMLNAIVWLTGEEVDEGGVDVGTVTLEQLEANQDYEPDDDWPEQRERVERQLEQWQAEFD